VGDRANVYIHEGDNPGVYLYTHWDGTYLPRIVKNSLESPRGRNRSTDCPYLTRIVLEDMISPTLGRETGYGVSAQIGDGEDRIVDVDVSYYREPIVTLYGYSYAWDNVPVDPYSYEEPIDW
jgi:hypothetical protein